MRTSHRVRARAVASIVVLLTVFSRVYRLAWQPLWLDELYSYQVSAQNLTRLLRNSLYESHPPLYYLLLKGAVALSFSRTEWSVRWLSAVCGAGAVLAVWYLAARVTDQRWALFAWLAMVCSPPLLYYSQEARSYIVAVLIAALSMVVVWRLLAGKTTPWTWIAWSGLSVAGVYTAYSYLMIVVIQALFLVWMYRRSRALPGALLACAASMAALIPALWANVSQDAQRASVAAPLTPLLLGQALLAGDPARYGVGWWSFVLPVVLSVLALNAIGAAYRDRRAFGWYLIAQVGAPLIGVFAIAAPVLGLRIPEFQSRQFLVLVPACVLLATLGLQWCVHRVPRPIGSAVVAIMCAAVIIASAAGINQYWATPKSPEGVLVEAVRQQHQADEPIVSLQYSLDAAASFYLADVQPIYNAPQHTATGYQFDQNLLILRGQIQRVPRISLANIRAKQPFWVLNDTRREAAARDALIQGCAIDQQQTSGPFEALRVTACP